MTPKTRRTSTTGELVAYVGPAGAPSPPSPIMARGTPEALKGRSGPALHFVALRSSLGLRPALDRPSVVADDAWQTVIFDCLSRPRPGPGRGPHHAPGQRRRRAGPRLSYAQPTGVFSEVHLPANCRTAVPTRAHSVWRPAHQPRPGAWSSAYPATARAHTGQVVAAANPQS